MIRVLLVDDHAIVRHGLRRILGETGDIKVLGEASNGEEALKIIRAGLWDVVLLDISMPGKNGLDTLAQIREENPDPRVLILSMHSEDQHAVRLMKAGASGYMTKDVVPEQLADAIRNVHAGNKHISPRLAELLLVECSINPEKAPHALLSDREFQVMRLLGSGMTVTEIAHELSLSVKTISTYRTNILEKMKLKNNAELTYYVVKNRLDEI